MQQDCSRNGSQKAFWGVIFPCLILLISSRPFWLFLGRQCAWDEHFPSLQQLCQCTSMLPYVNLPHHTPIPSLYSEQSTSNADVDADTGAGIPTLAYSSVSQLVLAPVPPADEVSTADTASPTVKTPTCKPDCTRERQQQPPPSDRLAFRTWPGASVTCASSSLIPVNSITQLQLKICIIQAGKVCSAHPHHQDLGQAKIIPDQIKSAAASGDAAQRSSLPRCP